MINWDRFDETLGGYGTKLILEIIDMYFEDHPKDMELIRQSIASKDFRQLNFSAHHLKGSVANFMDPDTTSLTLKLMEMGDEQTEEGLEETFQKLQQANLLLLQELIQLKVRLQSK